MADNNLVFLCKTGDLAPGSAKRIERAEGDIAVYNVDGAFYASDDRCTHGLASLGEGDLIGDEIECTMHFGSFNVKTGEPMAPPCSIPIKVYKVEVKGDEVFAIVD
ncbi:MAG: non-heme iron oxygenase ferredoxin subunit [Beijerinckiaceae bacterium]